MANVRIELKQLGDGQFVEVRDPRFLSWGEQRKLQTIVKENSVESQFDFAEKLAITLVKSGNVLDENGHPVQFPLNEQSIANVPAVVIEAVAMEFTKLRGGEKVPKN